MARLAVVDDTKIQRHLLVALLEKAHTVSAFPSGDALLAAIGAGAVFDLVLLDIEMPGIDGYETCRRLRADDATANLPVIFVSAHDTSPERVAAYQAGGDDFIVKPVAAHELQHKVSAMLQQRADLSALADQSRTAHQVAFTAMTSMGELGVLMDFMRRAATCPSPTDIADALLMALEAYGLSGAVQVRGPAGSIDRHSQQQTAPLQTSVMESLRDMGRIFVFGSRGIVNYARVSLLAHNLPTDDEDHLGRLRDNLALLAEGAETRLEAMEATTAVGLLQADARHTLDMLRTTLTDAAGRAHAARENNQHHTVELLDTLGRLIDSFNVTPIQRDTIHDLLHDGIEVALRHYDESALAEGDFERVIFMLEKLAKSKT
jgi:CheY-like chemotaxis protein